MILREHPEFVKLFHECGGDLHQVNNSDISAHHLDTPCPALDLLRTLSG